MLHGGAVGRAESPSTLAHKLVRNLGLDQRMCFQIREQVQAVFDAVYARGERARVVDVLCKARIAGLLHEIDSLQDEMLYPSTLKLLCFTELSEALGAGAEKVKVFGSAREIASSTVIQDGTVRARFERAQWISEVTELESQGRADWSGDLFERGAAVTRMFILERRWLDALQHQLWVLGNMHPRHWTFSRVLAVDNSEAQQSAMNVQFGNLQKLLDFCRERVDVPSRLLHGVRVIMLDHLILRDERAQGPDWKPDTEQAFRDAWNAGKGAFDTTDALAKNWRGWKRPIPRFLENDGEEGRDAGAGEREKRKEAGKVL